MQKDNNNSEKMANHKTKRIERERDGRRKLGQQPVGARGHARINNKRQSRHIVSKDATNLVATELVRFFFCFLFSADSRRKTLVVKENQTKKKKKTREKNAINLKSWTRAGEGKMKSLESPVWFAPVQFMQTKRALNFVCVG
jgi:hypothetical protein